MRYSITSKEQGGIVIPEAARAYIRNCCGEVGLKRIERSIYAGELVILDGVAASGKTTIQKILNALGYPFVMTTTDGTCSIIHTVGPIKAEELRPSVDILTELGLEI